MSLSRPVPDRFSRPACPERPGQAGTGEAFAQVNPVLIIQDRSGQGPVLDLSSACPLGLRTGQVEGRADERSMGQGVRFPMASVPAHHPGTRSLALHPGPAWLHPGRRARTPRHTAVQGRAEVRPHQLRKRMRTLQPEAGQQGTRAAARSQTCLFLVSLLDAAFWMLPALMLNAFIIYTAWCAWWI